MSSEQAAFWECIGIGAVVVGGAGILVGGAVGVAAAALTSAATVAGGAFIGGIAGGVVGATCGGIATRVALDLFAEEWKKKYFKKINDWIQDNSDEGSLTQKFYMKCHGVVSDAMAYVLQTRKKKKVKVDIVAEDDDHTETPVTTVKVPIEEVFGSGVFQHQVYLGNRQDFTEMDLEN